MTIYLLAEVIRLEMQGLTSDIPGADMLAESIFILLRYRLRKACAVETRLNAPVGFVQRL